MFNIQNKYTRNGCYRFLNNEARTIYIGESKNIHRILFNQHFKKNGSYGYLPIQCYKDTCKIEIIPTLDHAQALALKQYLIDTYMPKYNTKDKRKNLFTPTYSHRAEEFKRLENWKLYFTFREYDFNKIKLTKKQNKLSIVISCIVFIFIIIYLLKSFI